MEAKSSEFTNISTGLQYYLESDSFPLLIN